MPMLMQMGAGVAKDRWCRVCCVELNLDDPADLCAGCFYDREEELAADREDDAACERAEAEEGR